MCVYIYTRIIHKTLRQKSGQFSVDLVPRLLFGRSELVDVLVESGVARYPLNLQNTHTHTTH